jgi:cyclophilin family peptidyl-prolyl cis-trans isomerase
LYKQFSSTSITARYHNEITNGFDHIGFFKAKSKRIEILKQSNESWTIKENLEKQTIDFSFIQYCIDNGVNVYMTHRKNIVEQFISKINARYRLEIANLKPNTQSSQFIFTNEDSCIKYDTMHIPFSWLHMYTQVFIGQLFMWRVIYDRFKNDIKLVSYEDNIKPLQLEKFGITQQHIQQYQKEKVHLVPTPHNTNKVVITDDLPAPILGAWQQALYYVDRHRYLVEV